jgi:hypothetical protein
MAAASTDSHKYLDFDPASFFAKECRGHDARIAAESFPSYQKRLQKAIQAAPRDSEERAAFEEEAEVADDDEQVEGTHIGLSVLAQLPLPLNFLSATFSGAYTHGAALLHSEWRIRMSRAACEDAEALAEELHEAGCEALEEESVPLKECLSSAEDDATDKDVVCLVLEWSTKLGAGCRDPRARFGRERWAVVQPKLLRSLKVELTPRPAASPEGSAAAS